MKSNLIIDLCDYWMQPKRNLSLRNKKKNDCSALILSFLQCFADAAHISMRCVRHGMRHGCDSELELGLESKRGGWPAGCAGWISKGGWLEGIGCRSHKRIATLALAAPMSPTSLRNVQKWGTNMRMNFATCHNRRFRFSVQRSAFTIRTNKLAPARAAVSARKCSTNKWGSSRLTLVRQYFSHL